MTNYNVGLVEGFLIAHTANGTVMAAFRSILDGSGANKAMGGYQPKKAEIPPIAAPVEEEYHPTPPNCDTGGKTGWSRWTHEEMDTITDTVRIGRAAGKKTGEIIKELQVKFPERKYNAIYTKMMALDLISDHEVKPQKSKPAKKAHEEEEEQGEA